MSDLFSNKFKKPSGVVFYLSILVGLFLLLTDKIMDIFVVNVFSIFSYEWFGSEPKGFGWIENGLGDEIFTLLIIVSGLIFTFLDSNPFNLIRLAQILNGLMLPGITLFISYLYFTVQKNSFDFKIRILGLLLLFLFFTFLAFKILFL